MEHAQTLTRRTECETPNRSWGFLYYYMRKPCTNPAGWFITGRQHGVFCGSMNVSNRIPLIITPGLACRMANDLPLYHIHDHFRDIGGVVGDALQIFRDIAETHGA